MYLHNTKTTQEFVNYDEARRAFAEQMVNVWDAVYLKAYESDDSGEFGFYDPFTIAEFDGTLTNMIKKS